MTIRSFINFGQSLHRVGGININLSADGTIDASYCVLEHKKDVVTVVKYESGIGSVEEVKTKLQALLTTSSRLHVNLEGSQILSKSSEISSESLESGRVIKRLFPMIKDDEFVSQIYKSEKQDFYSIVREDVFKFINGIEIYYSITSVSMGPFIVASILPFLQQDKLSFGSYSASVTGNKIVDVFSLEHDTIITPINIGSDTLPAEILLAYSSAWYILFKTPELLISELPWVNRAVLKHTVNQSIYATAKASLIIVFSILVLNSVIYFWLQSETNELSIQDALFSGKALESNHHTKTLASLESAYEKLGWKSNIIPIFFADQIAKTIIPEIQLTSLEVGVLDQEMQRKEKRQSFNPGLIKVQGTTSSPVFLQKWIIAVERLSWIDKAYNQKYKHEAKQNKGIFEFYIRIK